MFFIRTVFAVTTQSYDCLLQAVSLVIVEEPALTECNANLDIGVVRLG